MGYVVDERLEAFNRSSMKEHRNRIGSLTPRVNSQIHVTGVSPVPFWLPEELSLSTRESQVIKVFFFDFKETETGNRSHGLIYTLLVNAASFERFALKHDSDFIIK